ncbi:HPr family phosphocarrier protein [Sporosarcina cascadiensis]|uniref:HPr family phosphocarrier protein n=1 Tax=Sporosarcina cascadiensis TaxID=2660747 RepID=UPI00129BF569|nr:HPr family phosphocarrier protein [Sporosarcina cascadiensis]
MEECKFIITDPAGIHARPASILVQTANQFVSNIDIVFRERTANLKSIIGVMALGIPVHAVISIRATGADEESAIKAFSEAISEQKLGDRY